MLSSHTTRTRQQKIRQRTVAQVRSVSLWGWGSSTSKDADFAKIHTPQSRSVPDAALGHDGQILAKQINPSSQSIPAVHHTSDSPPPTSISPEPDSTPTGLNAYPVDQSFSTLAETPASDAFDPVEALSEIPERIGYLKEVCGLDFGRGPSSMMQWLLEHIHINGDVSWATSIILLAVSARLLIFMPMIQASDAGAKFKAAQPVIGPARQRMKAAYNAGNQSKMAEARAEVKAIHKEYGLSSWKMLIPVMIQIPIQFGGFRLLRNMVELPVPAFEKEHWLWAHDLTLSDPYYIIPFVNAVVIYLTIKVRTRAFHSIQHFSKDSNLLFLLQRGGETGTAQLQGGVALLLSYIMPVLSFIFMCIQPGAVQLYFFISSLVAYSQSRILTNSLVRKFMRMHPTVTDHKTLTSPIVISSASPGSNNTNIAPTNHTTTPGIGPAGLKLYQPPPP